MTGTEASRTAFMAMDFINDIVHPDGAWGADGPASQVEAGATIENTGAALAAAREQGLSVIHVRVAWRKGGADVNPSAPLFQGAGIGILIDGTWGADFHDKLPPQPGELEIVKRSVSAFAGTELDRFLPLQGIRRLVLAGVLTNFVVEGTARDAVDRGYEVVVLEDCCASLTDEMHRFATQVVLPMIGTVTSSRRFVSDLAAS